MTSEGASERASASRADEACDSGCCLSEAEVFRHRVRERTCLESQGLPSCWPMADVVARGGIGRLR
eukprot:4333992-Prymnesium_polylepis.1